MKSGHRVGLGPKTFRMGGMRSNHYATSLVIWVDYFQKTNNRKVIETFYMLSILGACAVIINNK